MKISRRVVCKSFSTGLYCACAPADIVPLRFQMLYYCLTQEFRFSYTKAVFVSYFQLIIIIIK